MTYPPNVPNNGVNASPGKQKKYPKGLFLGIAVGLVIAALGVIALGYYVTNKGVDMMRGDATAFEISGSKESGTGSSRYPEKLSAEEASGDQFANLDPNYNYQYSVAEQMDYAAPILNADPQAVVARIQSTVGASHFTSDDGFTPRAIASPRRDNTPQEILDQIAVGVYQAWEVAQTGDIDGAKKLAVGVADPTHREYADQVRLFNSKLPNLAEGVAWSGRPVITFGSYEGVAATLDSPVIQFNSSSTTDTTDTVTMVARLDTGSSPKSARWRLVITKQVQ